MTHMYLIFSLKIYCQKELFNNKLSKEDEKNFIFENNKKSITGLILQLQYIKKFSTKFYTIINNLNNLVNDNACTAFVYSNLVKAGGMELFAEALIQNGYLEYQDESSNYDIKDDTRDYKTGLSYSEFKKKKMDLVNFRPSTFLLITGGTGSFGNAVIKRFLNTDIKEIRIFSRDEKKQHDMRVELKNEKLKFYIGDVRDRDSLKQTIKGVDFIFHAAALKQVPSCEFYPIEAVRTNILGTENVLNAAIINNVKKVVCLSTDKAVYPINAMGISKAMMEKVMVAKSRNSGDTTIVGTRYGNVMASRGSVIPLFHEQIKNNEPITITDPNMTRFMMTLEDAVELVLYAFENGNSGDIFVQKSPASTIGELAIALKKIYNSNIPVTIIGTRHAEKLYETLLSKEELLLSEDLGNYYRISADVRDLNYNKYFTEGFKMTNDTEDYHSHNTKRLNVNELVILLNKNNIKHFYL